MKRMAGRKRHSAEDIVRKLRRADELTAEGKTGEEIAAELGVSAATLYDWRRAYGGMDTDAAKELKELREQNARLKRLLAEAELVKDALREVAKGKPEPSCKRRAVDMLTATLGMSERLACKAVGLAAPPTAASPSLRPPPIQTPTCGPGCVPTPPSTRVTGSGVRGRRYATTRAARSTRRSTASGAKKASRSR